jgi:hypothetical protein
MFHRTARSLPNIGLNDSPSQQFFASTSQRVHMLKVPSLFENPSSSVRQRSGNHMGKAVLCPVVKEGIESPFIPVGKLPKVAQLRVGIRVSSMFLANEVHGRNTKPPN